MDQLITEVVIENKAMVKRLITLLSFVLMQIVFLTVIYLLEISTNKEAASIFFVILILSTFLLVTRTIAKEPRKIIFTAEECQLHYLFVRKAISVYELQAIDLLVIHKRPRKGALLNQHLYPAPYLTLQFDFGTRFLHLVPMYLGAHNNKDLPGHQKLLQAFLEKLLKADILPEVSVNRHQSTKD